MNQDGLYHISLMGGQARAILIESTQLVQRAKDIHGLSRIAAAALGRTLTCAAMMGSMLKGEDESITTQIRGGGPIGTVMAVAHGDCTVKGYVDNPGIDLPRTGPKLPVGAAVGKDGRLTVVKDMHLREPYVGQSIWSPARSPRTSPCTSPPPSRRRRWCRWACWCPTRRSSRRAD